MKIRKRLNLSAIVLATGVLLGRSAQADTLLTFDGTGTNIQIPNTFGDNVTGSSTGITVIGTNGTPNLDLSWSGVAGPHGGAVRWDFYNGGPWAGAQLNDCATNSSYLLVFTPTFGARAVIDSFNFAPYYADSRSYDFSVQLLDGETVLASQSVHLAATTTDQIPVSINYTGAVNQTITLQLTRTDDQDLGGGGAGTLPGGTAWGIAVDNIRFAEIPPAPAAPVASHVYPNVVLADQPLAYYRFSETAPYQLDVATNTGTLGKGGNGFHVAGVRHPVAGAISGDTNGAAAYDSLLNPEIDGGTPTIIPWPEKPLVRELWDFVGSGVLNNVGDGAGSIGFDSSTNWHLNRGTLMRVAQDVDITSFNPDIIPGPPANGGQAASVLADSNIGDLAHFWDRRSWATRKLAPSAQINFAADREYYFAFRIDNSGDTAMGMGFASGADDAASFVGVGAMWDTATGQDAGNAGNTVYISDGTLGQSDGPYAIRSYSFPGDINGPAFILARLTTTISGAATLSAALYYPGDILPTDPFGIFWRVEYSFNSTMTADHLLVWLNGSGTGRLDSIRVAETYESLVQGILNTAAGSFTLEAWLKPDLEGAPNAQCPLYHRSSTGFDGSGDRSGWDVFQRNSGTGWNFRMFNGFANSTVFDLTGGPYTVGSWNHFVAVYDASVPSASLYVNGQLVDSSSSPVGSYKPNPRGQIAIGSFGNATENSAGFENPFVGSIDEVAVYTNAFSPAQVLAHYQNGTNAARSTPYNTLVLADGPIEYLRLGEPARNIVTNRGSLGSLADAVAANTGNNVPGPRFPGFSGFDSSNAAVSFDGLNSHVGFNPDELNFTGEITLEAWIKLSSSITSPFANIIAHGVNASDTAEVMLRLTDVPSGVGSAYYQVGSWDGVSSSGATAPIPAADLSGANWVHLVGTYNGTEWNLYRNGVPIATNAGSFGSIVISNAAWAIGARGRWHTFAGTPDRRFAGSIDEAAIYNYALSPEEVFGHYYAGAFNQPTVTITRSGSNVIITWPVGVLQQADNVAGPYSDVIDADSPHVVPANTARKFYRARF